MRAATKLLHSVCAIWLCVAVTAQSAQAQRALDTAIERASDFSSERHLNGLSLPIWGGVRLEAMEMENAHRRMEISVPFPLLPATRFHRSEHDIESPYGYARQKGGAQSLRMSLPYGLTLEAGSQIDPFGRRHNDFIGLTFRLSDTRHHHQRIAAYKGGEPQPIEARPRDGQFPWLGTLGTLALVAALAGGGGGGGGSSDNNAGNPDGGDGAWQLVWNDEFSGDSLDTSKWSMTDSYGRDQCFGGGNNEQQCYTSSSNNIAVEDGKLVLTARPEAGLAQGRSYTSGRVQSSGKADFTYGRFEARIKLPSGQGSWPAFWMLPTERAYGEWPRSGEIDVMEAINLGVNGNRAVLGTLHFGTPHTYIGGQTTIDDINAFNTFAVEWFPDQIRWSLNGTQYASLSRSEWFSSGASGDPNAPFDRNFHMILNLAIGGNYPGASDGQNFPRQMEVDYVRVYQCDGASASDCK